MKKMAFGLLVVLLMARTAAAADPISLFLEKDGSKGKPHNLALADLKLHYAETMWYTESYFFIAYLDSGEIAYIQLLVSNLGMKKNQPALTLTIITPDRKRLTTEKDFAPADLKVGANNFSLKIGDNLLSGDDKNQKLNVRQEKLGFELEFASPTPGFKLGDGCAWFGEKKDIYFCINYPAPRARVSGYIYYDGKKVAASGWGYADHSWYNANSTDFERTWHNLKFFSPDQNLIISSFGAPENFGSQTVAVVALVNDQQVLMATTDLTVTESSFRFDSAGQKNYPQRILYEFKHPDYSGKISFDSSRVIEKMDVLEKLDKSAASKAVKWTIQTFVAKPFYYRAFGPTELDLTAKGVPSKIPGSASCETIFVK